MKRRSRPFAAVLAILALLFAQAMASVHACDAVSAKVPVTASAPAPMDGDCCDHGVPPPDPACDNHCQQGKQTTERAPSPAVAPLLSLGFVTATAIVAAPDFSASPPIAAPDLERDTQPPIPIRNCCFRI